MSFFQIRLLLTLFPYSFVLLYTFLKVRGKPHGPFVSIGFSEVGPFSLQLGMYGGGAQVPPTLELAVSIFQVI